MIHFDNSTIDNIVVHKVGNKSADEGIRLSNDVLRVSSEIEAILTTYFVSPFKMEDYFNFYHDTDLNLNETYNYVSKIFDNPNALYAQSVNLAKHLYEQSSHPKIKGGEFYVVYFRDCIVEGEQVDAVGIFKSENKDTFLKIYPKGEGFEVESQQGININKLDKGCLVFNTEREAGFVVAVVDNTNKGGEALYWIDDFLHLLQRKDDYYQTANAMALCKDFVLQQLPQEYETTRAEQVELLNKSAKFFKDKENFDVEEFANEVIQHAEVIDSFKNFKSEFEREKGVEIANTFEISNPAVKKQNKVFKSVIKLDKNFHIYIHGNSENIRKGFDDELGMNFYQLFFKEEN